MKITSINDSFFTLCSFDIQLLQNRNRRPYVLILRLKYKGKRQDFAIPFRSNIPSHTHKDLYFSLPPRSTTKQGHSHGLHYIKMFPITKGYLEKYHIGSTPYDQMLHKLINEKTKQIVSEAQRYLERYEQGNRPKYCVDIDKILSALNREE